MKVAFLTNVISPYRAPVFRELSRTAGWTFRVIVNAQTEFDRRWDGHCEGVDVQESWTWRFRRAHVSHHPVRTEQVVTTHVPIGLWRDLSRFSPDVVITHELGPRSLLASMWARAHRRPFAVWTYQSRAMGTATGRLRARIRDSILGHAAAIVGMGRQARDVLAGFGVAPDRIVDAPNATDVELITAALERQRADGSIETIRRTHADGKRIALFCGRLVPFKGLAEMLEAWCELPSRVRADWRLLVVGDGPLASAVDAAAQRADVVRLPSVPMRDVAGWYAAADLHLFPSLADAWGLSVQDAMLCGTPTLCSIHAGCADDLVIDGVDGLLFDPSTTEGMKAGLLSALSHPDLARLGERAAARARDFTPERLAQSFRVAVDRALSGSRRSDGAPALGTGGGAP
ncbi:MAG: glycosyltransferase family 4 protein [Planctomycetota bacterium]